MTLEQRIKDFATAVGTDIKDIRTSLQSLGGTSGVPALNKLLVYYGYPISFKGIYTNQGVIDEIGNNYKYWVVGDGLGNAAHEEYASTVAIVTGVRAKGVKVYGYVPIGQSTSNLTMAQIQAKIDEWTVVGVDGIFLDEFGFDYQNTRTRQVDAVNYVKSKGLPYCANAWTVEDFAIDDIANVPWPSNDWRYVNFQTYNPTNMILPRASTDSYMFENFGFSHEGLANVFDMHERALNVQALATSKNFNVWALAVFGENPAGTLNKTKIGTFKDVDQCGAYITANAYLFDFNIVGAGGFSFGAGGTPIEAPLYNLPSTAKPATSVAVNNYVYGTSVRYFGPVRLEVVNKTFEQYINIESVTQATLEDVYPLNQISAVTTTSRNTSQGYVGIGKSGTEDPTTSAGGLFASYAAFFDKATTYAGTLSTIATTAARRVHEVDEYDGFEVAVPYAENVVFYKTKYDALWTTWDPARPAIGFKPTNPRIHSTGKVIIPNYGQSAALSALCVMADINSPTTVWTTVDHPNLVARWNDCAYGDGWYVFVGTKGNVTMTRDFVDFTNTTIGDTNFDCRCISYCPVRKKFLMLSSINTGATISTGFADYKSHSIVINVVDSVVTPTLTDTGHTIAPGTMIGRMVHCVNPVNGSAIASVVDTDPAAFGNRIIMYYNTGDIPTSAKTGLFANNAVVAPNHAGNWRPRYVGAMCMIIIGWKGNPTFSSSPMNTQFYGYSNGVITAYKSSNARTPNGVDFTIGIDHSFTKYTIQSNNSRSFKYKIFQNRGAVEHAVGPTINGTPMNTYQAAVNESGANYEFTNVSNVSNLPISFNNTNGFVTPASAADADGDQNIITIAGSSSGTIAIGKIGAFNTSGTDTAIRRGKVYFEFKVSAGTPDVATCIGITTAGFAYNRNPVYGEGATMSDSSLGNSTGMLIYPSNGGYQVFNNGVVGSEAAFAETAYAASTDVWGVAIDFNKGKLWFRKNNGSWNANATNNPETGAGGFLINPNSARFYYSFIYASKAAVTLQFYTRASALNYAAPRGFGPWFGTSKGLGVVTTEDTRISAADLVEGQLMVVKDGLLKLVHPADVGGKSTYNLNLDENGIFTTVEVRHKTGTLYSRSVLSGGTSPQYTTRTESFYADDGTTVLFTQVYTLTYANGRLVSEVLQ